MDRNEQDRNFNIYLFQLEQKLAGQKILFFKSLSGQKSAGQGILLFDIFIRTEISWTEIN